MNRFHRFFPVLLVCLVLCADAGAQWRDAIPSLSGKGSPSVRAECPSGIISDYDIDIVPYQSFTLSWTRPNLDLAMTYEIILQEAGDYCTLTLDWSEIPAYVIGRHRVSRPERSGSRDTHRNSRSV